MMQRTEVRKKRSEVRSQKTEKSVFRPLFFVVCLLLSVVCFLFVSTVVAQDWQKVKGEHFIVYFFQDNKFAENVLNKAEEYYDKIADDLGYARHSNFWAWDKRVKIYIYPNRDAYLSYVTTHDYAAWSVGMANYAKKEIISYVQSRGFMDGILPHEITHLIFRDYVGQKNIPIWIDEGVAQWEEKGKRRFVKRKMRELLQHHEPISIERMMILNIGRIKNETIVELFYVEAVSLIDFLITEYGADNFIFFCRQLRDGKNMNEALKFAYPVAIRNVNILQDKWLEYLQKE